VVPRLLADALVVIHLGFIAFVVGGSLLLWIWPRIAWVHLPAAIWGALIEFGGWICPLTPMENHFRRAAGQAGYPEGFVEHYIIPVVYPAGLTARVQVTLGVLVIVLNLIGYGVYLRRRRRA